MRRSLLRAPAPGAPRPPSRSAPGIMLGKTTEITHDFEVAEG